MDNNTSELHMSLVPRKEKPKEKLDHRLMLAKASRVFWESYYGGIAAPVEVLILFAYLMNLSAEPGSIPSSVALMIVLNLTVALMTLGFLYKSIRTPVVPKESDEIIRIQNRVERTIQALNNQHKYQYRSYKVYAIFLLFVEGVVASAFLDWLMIGMDEKEAHALKYEIIGVALGGLIKVLSFVGETEVKSVQDDAVGQDIQELLPFPTRSEYNLQRLGLCFLLNTVSHSYAAGWWTKLIYELLCNWTDVDVGNDNFGYVGVGSLTAALAVLFGLIATGRDVAAETRLIVTKHALSGAANSSVRSTCLPLRGVDLKSTNTYLGFMMIVVVGSSMTLVGLVNAIEQVQKRKMPEGQEIPLLITRPILWAVLAVYLILNTINWVMGQNAQAAQKKLEKQAAIPANSKVVAVILKTPPSARARSHQATPARQ